MHALNTALGQMRSQNRQSEHGCEVPVLDKTDCNDFQQTLSEICLKLNSKIHSSIDTMLKEDTVQPHSIEDIDIDKVIDNLDPDLWKAICLLTQPLSARAIRTTSHVRKVRRMFCACVLLFTTNCQCSLPLHTLLTDVIETCGGSN